MFPSGIIFLISEELSLVFFFFNACLLVINSLFFYFYFCLGKSLFFIFAVCFCWYRIINWQLFSFNTLKMSIHYALTSIISAGKSGVSLFCCPFEWLSSPPPPRLLLRFLSVFGFTSLAMIYVSVMSFILLQLHWTSWICALIIFISLRNFLAIISSMLLLPHFLFLFLLGF